jgi:His/Glu/Gln/Arg/opine family amino acid ABC transporter permease subunit
VDLAVALAWLPRLIQAAALTIALAAAIFVLSGVAALALALIGYGRPRSRFTYAVEGFSALFRSIPELVVLFLFYFGGVQLGIDFGPIGSTILAFGLIGIAYDYQVFKGALSAIPFSQYEAGRSLALPTVAIYARILLPQLLPLAKPGWITYAIGTVKRVSIASAVSVSEILYVTKQAIAATNAPFVFLALAVALYILIVTPLIAWNEVRLKRRPA